MTAYALASRLARLIAELADEGLHVDQAALEACWLDGVQAPYITHALRAALHTVRGDDAKVVPYMARFWGLDQDRALERLFSSGAGRLLASPGKLLNASAELLPRLRRRGYSFHSILAEAALIHYAGRAAPDVPHLAAARDRREAMIQRSQIMGILIEHNDIGLARRYERMIADSPVLALIEEWAFPTYTRDARPEPGFTLPRSLLLKNTAAEVIREVDCYSDAYVYYLLAVYIPLALSRDSTFGLALPRLKAAIRQRLDQDGDSRLRILCQDLLRNLEGVSSD